MLRVRAFEPPGSFRFLSELLMSRSMVSPTLQFMCRGLRPFTLLTTLALAIVACDSASNSPATSTDTVSPSGTAPAVKQPSAPAAAAPSAPKVAAPKIDLPKADIPTPVAPPPVTTAPTTPPPEVPPPVTPAPVDPPKPADPKADAPKDEMKPFVEYWPGTQTPKFRYEYRKDPADNKWKRNGAASAYYATGILEREGVYKNNSRVGMWKYYDVEGNLLDEKNHGDGSSPETDAPSQR